MKMEQEFNALQTGSTSIIRVYDAWQQLFYVYTLLLWQIHYDTLNIYSIFSWLHIQETSLPIATVKSLDCKYLINVYNRLHLV